MRTEIRTEPPGFDENVAEDTVRRALRGDVAAFEQVIALYSRKLYAVAYGVVQNAAEAEDVVQDTFLKAYARRWLIRDPKKLPAWLCCTARNRACDILRRRSREFIPDEVPALDTIVSWKPCPRASASPSPCASWRGWPTNRSNRRWA
jgi:DNA-directed RNA polymerase specialized sigma24 family protein